MSSFEKIKEKVEELSKKVFANKEKDYILEEVFPTLSIQEQAQLLEVFHTSMKSFTRYLNNTKIDILSLLERGMEEYEKSGKEELIPFLSTYLNIDDVVFDDAFLSPIIERLNESYDQRLNKNKNFILTMESFLKSLAYTTPSQETHEAIKNSKTYKSYESLLQKYIRSLSEEELLDNELISLIIDARYALKEDFDFAPLKEKIGEVSLEKYKPYIEKGKEMDEETKKEFRKDVKKYRIRNFSLEEEICLYINKHFEEDQDLLRLASPDLVRDYLKRNGVENPNVIYDELITRFNTKGLSSWNLIILGELTLSMMLFHEATHLIQFDNERQDKSYYGYRYSMLKDRILQERLNPVIYNRNHNRYLFEIDADIQGKKEYYRILEKLGQLEEGGKEEREKLKAEEKFRISLSSYLNIDGYNYDKDELFDTLIQENHALLEKYPILNIEYKPNGTRKNAIEILQELEYQSLLGKREDEEIKSIAECIFQEESVIGNAEETIKMLNDYVPGETLIQEMEQKIIEGLTEFLKEHNIGELMKQK